LATEISRERANPTFWSYAEKVGQGKGKQIVLRRARILPGEKILLCEDALTTGGSTTMLATAVEEAGAQALPFVVTFANQSGEDFIDDRRLISGFRRIIPTWTPDQCPLCKDGSEAIPAKGENWKRLNAEY
jgi:orotate phosphoribosyltransferase